MIARHHWTFRTEPIPWERFFARRRHLRRSTWFVTLTASQRTTARSFGPRFLQNTEDGPLSLDVVVLLQRRPTVPRLRLRALRIRQRFRLELQHRVGFWYHVGWSRE